MDPSSFTFSQLPKQPWTPSRIGSCNTEEACRKNPFAAGQTRSVFGHMRRDEKTELELELEIEAKARHKHKHKRKMCWMSGDVVDVIDHRRT